MAAQELVETEDHDPEMNVHIGTDVILEEHEDEERDDSKSGETSSDDNSDAEIPNDRKLELLRHKANYSDIRAHPSFEQVMLDVSRCAGRLEHIRQCYLHRTDDDEPTVGSTNDSEDETNDKKHDNNYSSCESSTGRDDDRLSRLERDLKCQQKLKRKLAKLIVRLLIENPEIHYYQGFHDVCLTYMTIYGAQTAFSKLNRLIDSHFSQFMRPTMLETQEFLALIPIIIGQHNAKLADFLDQAEVGTIFALSWTITWFSHVIPNEHDVETIFSFLESFDDPYVILYLCAAIVVYKKEQIFRLEPEMSTVHHFLCQVPRKEKLPIKDLLETAERSYRMWPPDMIKRKLDNYRRAKLQVHNYNQVQNMAQRLMPSIANFISAPTPRMAIVVLVLASALAFQWTK